MTREQVWKRVAESLREPFGRLLEVRDVRRVRRVAGDAWTVSVVLHSATEDLHVADVHVDDAGRISPVITADDVVHAVKNQKQFTPNETPDELADFGDGGLGSEPRLDLLTDTRESIEARVLVALAKGDRASLLEARKALPLLLTDHDRQGETLFGMAEVEVKLGEKSIAKGYLEAAAREFADRFDLPSLEKAAALALDIEGRDSFTGSAIHALLENSRARLKPLDSIFEARTFIGTILEVRANLLPHVELRTLAPGETLVSEGEPSRDIFVVKSGLLGVWLEKPSGGSVMVRCCFPGWLLGESSVLGPPGTQKCTATLRAERITEVWVLPSSEMRKAMKQDLELGLRVGQTKQLHRIDSFFSMHETMGQLDVLVRDEMLACIQRLETFDNETVLLMANQVPDVALLVARGGLDLFEEGKDTKLASVEADHFYGVRDAIHRMAPSVSAVTRPGTTVAFFDAEKLQELCERSPEQVIAVLERLG